MFPRKSKKALLGAPAHHGKQSRSGVGDGKSLVIESLAVNALATSAVPVL